MNILAVFSVIIRFTKRSTTIAMILLVAGCAMFSSEDEKMAMESVSDTAGSMQVFDITGMQVLDNQNVQSGSSEQPVDYENLGVFGQPPVYSSVQGAYKGRPLSKHIGDYVRNMTQDLIGNMNKVTTQTPIAVTHFALLDSNLQETNLLGHQMAESFVHELHKFRIPIIDFKATDFVRVTANGDFLLSRDYLELETGLPLEFLLTGTLTKHQGGFLVNARILGLDSKAVVASAQTLIPFYVVDALIPSERSNDEIREGVKVTQG